MNRLLRHIFPTLILWVSVLFAHADIGETHTLKKERAKLEHQIEVLNSNSLEHVEEIQELYNDILALDQRIFESYDETVNRVSSQKLTQSSNDRLIVYLALGTSLIALFFAIMLYVVRGKVMHGEYSGLRSFYRELTMDFTKKVSPEKSGANSLLRVNIVVLAGLILMSISILSFLIKSL